MIVPRPWHPLWKRSSWAVSMIVLLSWRLAALQTWEVSVSLLLALRAVWNCHCQCDSAMFRIALRGASNLAGQCSPSACSIGVLSEIAPSVVMTPVIVSRVLLHLNMIVTATALPTWEVSAPSVQLEGCLTFIMCLLWPYVIVLQLHCPHVIVLWQQQPSITVLWLQWARVFVLWLQQLLVLPQQGQLLIDCGHQ